MYDTPTPLLPPPESNRCRLSAPGLSPPLKSCLPKLLPCVLQHCVWMGSAFLWDWILILLFAYVIKLFPVVFVERDKDWREFYRTLKLQPAQSKRLMFQPDASGVSSLMDQISTLILRCVLDDSCVLWIRMIWASLLVIVSCFDKRVVFV